MPSKKVDKTKYIAIQEGCENVIFEQTEYGGSSQELFDDLKKIEKVVEEAIDESTNGFDDGEGDVIIYKLVPVKRAKATKVQFVNL